MLLKLYFRIKLTFKKFEVIFLSIIKNKQIIKRKLLNSNFKIVKKVRHSREIKNINN